VSRAKAAPTSREEKKETESGLNRGGKGIISGIEIGTPVEEGKQTSHSVENSSGDTRIHKD